MDGITARDFVERVYRQHFGSEGVTGFSSYLVSTGGAALGYRRASQGPLFLETYLSRPVEEVVSDEFARRIERDAIVELGNLASTNAIAMIDLWGAAANDLGACGEIAVATLTLPLRRMFQRTGIAIREIGVADPARLGTAASRWGSYYRLDPRVCAGEIAQGQKAIAAFRARRGEGAAA